MADLLLDELRIDAVLDAVRDVRIPKAARHECFREPQLLAVESEPVLDLTRPKPTATFGQPQGGVGEEAVAGTDVDDVVLQGLHGPEHDAGDVPPTRPLGPLGLADVHQAVPAELWRLAFR
ncbi:hypothetical protein [Streptomyces niveiscabiei]|uniref:Uncharacterized protein n=1 Tax=Streptomyces niveiscabiei TaxID=164115 RepID=A0ABW9I735_9ACTN